MSLMEKGVEPPTITQIQTSPPEQPQFVDNAALTKQIIRKCDLRLIPPLMLLFLITFIDRTNIANAKIEGMTAELHMGPTDYNKALWILNIPYITLALPSNLLMKRGFVRPGTYLSGLMFCWCKHEKD